MKKDGKIMKRIGAILLTLALLLGLCACGSKESLAGTWYTEIDITSFVTEESGIAMAFGMEDGIEMDTKLLVPIHLELKEDGTYTMSLVQETFSENVNEFFAELIDVIVDVTYEMAEAEGATREMIDEASGGDLKTYVQSLFESMDMESMLESEELEESGAWKAEDGKLYLADSADEFSDDNAEAYQLDGSKLTIELGNSDLLDLSTIGYEGTTLVFEKK